LTDPGSNIRMCMSVTREENTLHVLTEKEDMSVQKWVKKRA
jgi:hypothetical protein